MNSVMVVCSKRLGNGGLRQLYLHGGRWRLRRFGVGYNGERAVPCGVHNGKAVGGAHFSRARGSVGGGGRSNRRHFEEDTHTI